MKKRIITIVTTAVLTMALCFSLTACFFLRNTGDIANLPDSASVSTNVVFGNAYEDGETRQELSLPDAVAMVERSSVAIYLSGSVASGVLIDVSFDGNQPSDNSVYVITNHHVVDSAGVINVAIPDKNFNYYNEDYIFGGVVGNFNVTPTYLLDTTKTMQKAVTLIGGDPTSDIAVLKIDLDVPALSGDKQSLSNLVTAKIPSPSYALRRGDSVFSVGNPTGILPGSVSSGVVSYLERPVTTEGIERLELQIDAHINPGSSGGGLYNLYGELVGITSGGYEDYEALNFAIPISVNYGGRDNGFVQIAKELIATYNSVNGENFGYITGRRQTMGFTVSKVTESGSEHVVILSVTAGSLAEKEGLKANDVITAISINGVYHSITSYNQFVDYMASLEFGDTIKIEAVRTGSYSQIKITAEFEIRQFIFCDTGIYPDD